MAITLRTLLKLPEIKPVQRTTQHEVFVKEFRLRIGKVNNNLQKVASQGDPSVHKPLNDLRSKVIAAQQKALELIDPTDASKAEPAIKRVLEAVDAIDQKASRAAKAVGAERNLWLELEEELDEIVQQSSELEDAGHPKATILRKIGEVARGQARVGKFQEAVVAVNHLRPKFQKILAEQQDRQVTDAASVDAQPPAGNGPREGLSVLVKDQTTGEAIEGVGVAIGDQSDTTNSHGLATFELPVGVHEYNVTVEGYEPVSDSMEIVAGDNPELFIEMNPGAGAGAHEGLTVFVRDWETGEGIEGAQVKVGGETDTTSSNGLATVELPVAMHDYEVLFDGYESASGQVEILEGENSELVVEMYRSDLPREGLTVLVRDGETGAAVEGAMVSVGSVSDVTSPNGLATLELPVGIHRYEVTAEGHAFSSGEFEVVEGDNEDLVIELTLDDSNAGRLDMNGEQSDGDLGDELADAERFVNVWTETLSDVSTQVDRLRAAMEGSDEFGMGAVRDGLANVVKKFPDLDLTKLVSAAKANDRASYQQTLEQTAKEVREVRNLLSNGPLLSTIDENPFVSTDVHAKVTGVLDEIVAEFGI